MKPSAYNILVDDLENGDTIIFNSLYGSMATFEKGEMPLVNEILDNPNHQPGNSTELIEALVAQKYLIADDVNEMAIIENRKMSGIRDANRLDVIIMPTLDCNFNCIYCYEDKKPGKMSDKTVGVIKKWMAAEIPKHKLVLLSWFGGEPLMGIGQIEEITKFANETAGTCETEMITHITTNGSLLTKERVQKLVSLNIFNYQVTIDGIAGTHNQLRPLRNGKGSFDKVFENIILLVKENPKVKVTLRVNFNHTNLHTVPELLNLFPKKYRRQLRLTLEPIFGSCEYNATDNLQAEDISKTIAGYYKMASGLGYDITIGKASVTSGKLVYCYAEREEQYIINYNGDIFKCSVDSFEPANRAGRIGDDGVFIKNTEKWESWMNIPLFDGICTSCKYLPLCMGGCRKTRIQNKNTGSVCALIPTNASYILKQISLNGFKNIIIKENNS